MAYQIVAKVNGESIAAECRVANVGNADSFREYLREQRFMGKDLELFTSDGKPLGVSPAAPFAWVSATLDTNGNAI